MQRVLHVALKSRRLLALPSTPPSAPHGGLTCSSGASRGTSNTWAVKKLTGQMRKAAALLTLQSSATIELCLGAAPCLKPNFPPFHFPPYGIWDWSDCVSSRGMIHRAASLHLAWVKRVTKTESAYIILRFLSDFTGSVLRLDVDTDMCNVPYSIPRSNPHFNSTNQPPEVFAHGLHDPGR